MNNIIVGQTAGFCFGIENAVKKTQIKLDELSGKVYSLGEIAHNKEVVNKLTNKGLIVIDDIKDVPDDIKHLIIRAHGTTKEIYQEAKEKGLELIDLTCPKVLLIHQIVEKYRLEDYYIFLTGEKDHPEVIGTISFCDNHYSLINNEDDILLSLKAFKESNKEKALIISQTTFNLDKFKLISEILKKELAKTKLIIESSICDATRLRQEETKKIASEVDIMIIVGGKHSSNTTKLYEISKEYCSKVIHIETAKELNIEFDTDKKIGIMAGASTPKESVDEVIVKLKRI